VDRTRETGNRRNKKNEKKHDRNARLNTERTCNRCGKIEHMARNCGKEMFQL